MTGKHPSAFAHVGAVPTAAQAIEQAEQHLYIITHEIRLLADLAGTGVGASGSALSVETLAVALASYADRLAQVHARVQQAQRTLPAGVDHEC